MSQKHDMVMRDTVVEDSENFDHLVKIFKSKNTGLEQFFLH